ncbi:MAG TPA: hypothetical protein VEQ63_12315 [Bryobacteraceae bacterium]|nr:hypothetical protein [Bryobacteraceae bacterium]
MKHVPAKARMLTAVVVLTNVLGNLALSLGMKSSSTATAIISNPLVVVGVGLLILWTLSRMALMSWADLSYILPITSIGYVLTALAGKFVLAESISGPRWWGTLLIFAGMVIVSRTRPRTEPS